MGYWAKTFKRFVFVSSILAYTFFSAQKSYSRDTPESDPRTKLPEASAKSNAVEKNIPKPIVSKAKLIVVAGLVDKKRHLRVSEEAKKVFEGLQYETALGMGFVPEFEKPEFAFTPIESGKDLSTFVKKESSRPSAPKPLVVFINDHGDRGTHPLGAGISLVESQEQGSLRTSNPYTHHRLLDDLRDSTSPETPIKLIGIHCFSGGLHSVAQQLPNACSVASSTYHRTTGSPADDEAPMNFYAEGFLGEMKTKAYDVDGDSKSSLLEAHVAGMFNDRFNRGRQNISSMDYVLQVLKMSPYAPETQLAQELEEELQLQSDVNKSHGAEAEASDFHNPRGELYRTIRFPLRDHLDIAAIPKLESAPKELQNFVKGLDEIATKKGLKNFQTPTLVEANTKLGIVQKKIDKLKVEKKELIEIANKAEGTDSELRAKKAVVEKLKEINAAVEELTKLKHANPDYAQMAYKYWLDTMASVERFYQVATPQEKVKFEKLLKCEMEAL